MTNYLENVPHVPLTDRELWNIQLEKIPIIDFPEIKKDIDTSTPSTSTPALSADLTQDDVVLADFGVVMSRNSKMQDTL
ncbi:hypothetical protein TSAR_000284 [Trichomalopsis sarcophagae]|uniref:Uncharacterized protein n=1 Tax=Trichomalopsis sarcophagae TaxID=543379 RepID=A0A232ERU1_9HYME|nr:hypothetical protein TSAR_000284 [Trichomalopsis sarcophagae]